jgi:hypothetical protein
MKETIKEITILAAWVVFCGWIFYASSANAKAIETTYKTTRITPGDVLVSCKDGSKPAIKVLDDGRMVIVTCQ